MKDGNLEKKFDEYFDGVNTPEHITDDAKKYVGKKKSFLPVFVKFASVAASFALVLTVAFVIIVNARNSSFKAEAPPPASLNNVYGDGSLTYESAEVERIAELNPSLAFISELTEKGAVVSQCSAGYMNGKLALVKAEVSIIFGDFSHDTQIYVEFTGGDLVYEPLSEYPHGAVGNYDGTEYRLTGKPALNGNTVNKLYFSYEGVKYYFTITSADENSYAEYLKLIIK